MAVTPKICMLTVHGIGFQQPPQPGIRGYADGLHQNLTEVLGDKLGNDPNRQPETEGPVYVMSAKPTTRDTEWGLSRLGTWRGGALDITETPLAESDRPIAHVALIYTSLEDVRPLLGNGTGTVSEAGLLLGQYASVAGAMRLVCGDTWAAIHENGGLAGEPTSLRPRTDLVPAHRFSILRFLHPDLAANQPGGCMLAIRRLVARPDVLDVVVNAHSQGTVASYDVLQQSPLPVTSRVNALVTAGSPLRKYADLFSWGSDVGATASVGRWLNFWDAKDPVADPLDQPPSWHFGNDVVPRPTRDLGLFWALRDAGCQEPVPITDHKVDNIVNSSGGGLQAHNYWGNKTQFIPELAATLQQAL
jgi:hypothetical protein